MITLGESARVAGGGEIVFLGRVVRSSLQNQEGAHKGHWTFQALTSLQEATNREKLASSDTIAILTTCIAPLFEFTQ